MRIALLSGEYPPMPGGVGDYTRRLGQALVARGHQVLVFTIYDLQFTIYDLRHQDDTHISEIVNRKSDWGWRCWREVIAALEATHPEVLHLQYQTSAYAMHPAINLLPWRLRGLPNRPRVAVTAHDLLLPYLLPKAGPLRRWVTRRLLADADAAVVTNEGDLIEASRFELRDRRLGADTQPPTRIPPPLALIPIGSNIPVAPPPGYERAAWRAGLGVAPDQTLIAFFGLISHSKGLHVLLDALARLPASFRLIVVGGEATQPMDRAYAAKIRRQIEERGLRDRTIMTGHCAEEHVSAHLLAADLAALPFADGASFRRGSLLAALAHGLPVITTTDDRRPTAEQEPRIEAQEPRPIAALHMRQIEQLADDKNVLLVAPENPALLAATIERLAGDTALRARLGESGRELAAQFSWERIAEQHEALYQNLLGRGPI
ncbi:MAG TPA: glycosyltransferase family 4 protein [Roseiflexaceae bacterium]|nr:glycosyltransferase family 4 protein [Roseiflexaceae bacterium]